MFTDTTARQAIAAIRGEITDLGALVAAANERMAALADRLATLAGEVARLDERDDGHDGALNELSGRIDATTEHQSAAFREQGDRLDDIERVTNGHHEEMVRLGVEVDRLRLQATLDNKEMRGNYAALVEVVARDAKRRSAHNAGSDHSIARI